MNVITMNGCAVGSPKDGATQTGTVRTTFVLETDGGELPLRFNCICFGACAEKAAGIVDGDEVLLTGRMTASTYTAHRAMTVVATNLEILKREILKHGDAA